MAFLLLHPVGCVLRRIGGHSRWLGTRSVVLLMAHRHGSVPVYNTHVLPIAKASSWTRFKSLQTETTTFSESPERTVYFTRWTAKQRSFERRTPCAMSVCSAVVCTEFCVTVSAICRIAAKCGCWMCVLRLAHLSALLFSLRKSTYQLTSAYKFNSLETHTGK